MTLVFKPNGALVGDILKVELLDYSGVLADCLQGAVSVPYNIKPSFVKAIVTCMTFS